tara:strand:- start:1252 stop:1407 length:156 start_codon:yes stop_codon:yes gene_type:complete
MNYITIKVKIKTTLSLAKSTVKEKNKKKYKIIDILIPFVEWIYNKKIANKS